VDFSEVFYGALSLPRLAPGQKRDLIAGLSFENPANVPLKWGQTQNGGVVQTAQIVGKFPRSSGRVLTVIDHPTALSWNESDPSGGRFFLNLPVTAERTTFSLKTVDASGKTENQSLVLTFKTIKKIAYSPWLGTRPVVSLGVMTFNYSENYKIYNLSFKQSEILPVLKAGYYFNKKRWLFGFSLFGAPFALTNNLVGSNSTLYGAEAKVGYFYPKNEANWRLSVYLGLYYSSMLVSSNYFGYNGAFGPQISALYQRLFWTRHTLYGYAKISPFPVNGIMPDLSNREIAFGGGWIRPLGNQHSLILNLEYTDFLATFKLVYNNIQDIHYLRAGTLGFTVGYGF
jgi:hypothetical protein